MGDILQKWELQISCFKEFGGEGATLGLIPACRPHTLEYACTLYAPTSPPLTLNFPSSTSGGLERAITF